MPNYSGAGGRPSGQKTAPPEVKEYWKHLVQNEGMSPAAAAEKVGYSRLTGKTWNDVLIKGKKSGPNRPFEGAVSEIPPKELEDLDDTAYAAIQDSPEAFELFRSTYLGRTSRPWQEQACVDLLAAEHEGMSSEDQLPFYAILNVFPGGGKSTTITHDWVLWRIVSYRARGLERRVQLGSRTITQARSYTMRVRQTLESNIDLIRAYGRFKPIKPDLWEQVAFQVESLPGVRHDEKEPTVFAVSQDSGFLGFRAHLCVWDDLVSKANSRTMEGRDALRVWWADEAESRVEPGGLVALVGTRLGPADLFRSLADLRVVETEETDDPLGLEQRPIYHHIVYPVHAEDRCPEVGARTPDKHRGCLNDPKRYPWRRILRLKVQLGERFELTWQQSDTGGEVGLVRRVWLEGGDDENGNLFVGCYDYERGMWEPPPQSALEDYRGVITVDPSPTMYWAVQLWVFDRKHDLDYLVGQERKKMDIPTLLDMQDGKYVGLLEEFIQHASRLQVRVKHLVWEANAAQRFVLQYPFFRDWARSHGIILMGHTTSGPKLADPDYGIEMLGPRYMHGKIRLPFKGTISKDRVNPLINELLSWPDGDYDDCVKAQWFGHYNRDRLGAGKDARKFYTDDIELPPALAAARRGGDW